MKNEELTKLFYVIDSTEDNEELFITREEAENEFLTYPKENKPRLYIAEVKNAFFEEDLGGWSYDDNSDTFNIIKILETKE